MTILTGILPFIVIMLVHWIADFVCQPDEIAKTKASDIGALFLHIFIYFFINITIYGLIYNSILFPIAIIYKVLGFIVINSILHFITDFITAPIVSSLFKQEDYHNAFVVIGFDQFIHLSCLFVIYGLL